MARSHWRNAIPDEPPADPTAVLLATPEPAERIKLEPLFPVDSFTPLSRCPHHCARCGGDGGVFDMAVGAPVVCPDCGGSGHAGIPDGSWFCCMVCHRSGLDGTRAMPLGVKPLPISPPEPEPEWEGEVAA